MASVNSSSACCRVWGKEGEGRRGKEGKGGKEGEGGGRRVEEREGGEGYQVLGT